MTKKNEIDDVMRVLEWHLKYRHSKILEITLKNKPRKKLVGHIYKTRSKVFSFNDGKGKGSEIICPYIYYFRIMEPGTRFHKNIIEVDPFQISKIAEIGK